LLIESKLLLEMIIETLCTRVDCAHKLGSRHRKLNICRISCFCCCMLTSIDFIRHRNYTLLYCCLALTSQMIDRRHTTYLLSFVYIFFLQVIVFLKINLYSINSPVQDGIHRAVHCLVFVLGGWNLFNQIRLVCCLSGV